MNFALTLLDETNLEVLNNVGNDFRWIKTVLVTSKLITLKQHPYKFYNNN